MGWLDNNNGVTCPVISARDPVGKVFWSYPHAGGA
jgi:hypothetical protein